MHAGQTLDTRWVRPTQWTQPFPACVALEPTLPDENGIVGMREVSLEDAQACMQYLHLTSTCKLCDHIRSGHTMSVTHTHTDGQSSVMHGGT